jgi:hypothetical protein
MTYKVKATLWQIPVTLLVLSEKLNGSSYLLWIFIGPCNVIIYFATESADAASFCE